MFNGDEHLNCLFVEWCESNFPDGQNYREWYESLTQEDQTLVDRWEKQWLWPTGLGMTKPRCAEASNIQKLPEMCYYTSSVSGEIVRLFRGVMGYQETRLPITDKEEARKMAQSFNEKLGVSKAQAEAMYCGSLFGFHVPGADPDNYDENGVYKTAQ